MLNFSALALVTDYCEEIKKCLLWALRYELDPIVRAEACHSLFLMAGSTDQDVIEAFEERHLIESEPLVKAYELFKLN